VLDRFARSMRELVNALAEFEGLGIDFIFYNEGADTTTPQGPAYRQDRRHLTRPMQSRLHV